MPLCQDGSAPTVTRGLGRRMTVWNGTDMGTVRDVTVVAVRRYPRTLRQTVQWREGAVDTIEATLPRQPSAVHTHTVRQLYFLF